jgi:hypothetical protein
MEYELGAEPGGSTGTRIPDPPFSSFGPSRDYGMDLCLRTSEGPFKNWRVIVKYRVEARIPSLYFDDCFIPLCIYK